MRDVDHNKKTGAKIKDLFVTEDEYLEAKKAQAEELLKDAKNGKKCREDEENVDGKCKKKKKYVAYARGIGYGIAIPDPLNNPDGDTDGGDNNSGDTSSDTGGTDGSASGGSGDGGAA